MQTPIRTFVPGLLLAFSATAVHANPEVAPASATGAATAQPAKPTGVAATAAAKKPTTLAAPAAATKLSGTLAPAPASAGAAPAVAVDPALPPAVALPAPPVDPLQGAPAQVREVVSWITRSYDNTRLPFLVIDKPTARVYAFTGAGQYQGDAPVLLGMGPGDRMLLPSAAMSQMPPHTRITPAGRFVSKLAKDAKGKELLVLDYKAAFSLHPVVKGKPHERRADRLASVTADDNRISFGCINVPVPFYNTVISPAFTGTHGIVYILPETSEASAMFGYNPIVESIASGPQAVTPAGPQSATAAGAQAATPAGTQPVTTALNATAGQQTVPEAAAK